MHFWPVIEAFDRYAQAGFSSRLTRSARPYTSAIRTSAWAGGAGNKSRPGRVPDGEAVGGDMTDWQLVNAAYS